MLPVRTEGVIALWGSSDLPGVGDQVYPRVLERELHRRLPGWGIPLYTPLGASRPSVSDGGIVAVRLTGKHTAHVSVLCPSFALGADLGALYGTEEAKAAAPCFATEAAPTVLSAGVRLAGKTPTVLAVRDARSSARAGGHVPIVPHLGVLAGNLVERPALFARQRQLRQLGELPADKGFLLLHLTADLVAQVDLPALRAALGDREVLVMPTGPVPGELGDRVLPADLAFEDRIAALAAADAVIAADEHVAAVCAGLGVPFVLLDPSGEERWPVQEFAPSRVVAGDVPALVQALESVAAVEADAAKAAAGAHLDSLAIAAENLLAAGGEDPQRRIVDLVEENEALRVAHSQLRQRQVHERQVLMDQVVSVHNDLDKLRAELDHERELHRQLADRHQALAAQSGHAVRELDALRRTKLLRWSQPLREAYGKIKNP